MSVGPIPWSAIHQYAAAKGVADAERFERLIQEMDAAWLSHHHRQIEKETDG